MCLLYYFEIISQLPKNAGVGLQILLGVPIEGVSLYANKYLGKILSASPLSHTHMHTHVHNFWIKAH